MVYWYYLLFGTCFLIWPSFAEISIEKPRRIIIDVDVGSDDAFAILTLLDADKSGIVKVEAIVCSMGNTDLENVCKNVIRILELLERTDIPVYKGAVDPLIIPKDVENYYGKDGLGDLEYERDPNLSIIRREPAIKAMYDIVMKNPKEITLICVGPLTNAAFALKIFDEVADNIKEMFIMGGNYLGIGNARDSAEFNFYVDPESAHAVLEETRFPITIFPWEACLYAPLTLEWRFNELGKYNSSAFMDLLNAAEKNIFANKPLDYAWKACDAFMTIIVLHPDVVLDEHKYNLTVEIAGENTRGQVIVRRKEDTEKSNINVIRQVNYNKIMNILIDIVQRLV